MQAFLLDLPGHAQGSAALACAGLALTAFLGPLLFVPRTLLAVAGGFLFGWLALPVVLVAGTGGTALACAFARRLLRPRLLRVVDGRPTCRALLAAVDQEGWRVVGLLRLAGPLPCSAQSYLLGLTAIPVWTVAAVSLASGLPQAAFYVHLGAVGHAVLRDGAAPPFETAILVTAALCVAALVALIGRRARRILAGAAEPAAA